MLAVVATLLFYGPKLRGKLVLIRVDNAGTAHNINRHRSGLKTALPRRAHTLRLLAWRYGFEYVAVHTPREWNGLADALSKAESPAAAHASLPSLGLPPSSFRRAPRVLHSPAFSIPDGSVDGGGRIRLRGEPDYQQRWWADWRTGGFGDVFCNEPPAADAAAAGGSGGGGSSRSRV
jgi:hypothetical protein